MSTLAQMRTRIADDLNRTDLASQINKAINRAINHYESENTWFNETSDTFTTVASQQVYTTADGLPNNILEINRVTFTQNASAIYTLTPRTIEYILDINLSSTTYSGLAYDYAWWDGSIYLYPTPDDAYTVTIYYKKSYADLAADGDSNDWTDNAEDLIESRAEWWLYSRILHNPEYALIHKQDEMDALSQLRVRSNDLVSTNKIRGICI